MSGKPSTSESIAILDILVSSNFEASLDSQSDYVQVNPQEEWNTFLSLIQE